MKFKLPSGCSGGGAEQISGYVRWQLSHVNEVQNIDMLLTNYRHKKETYGLMFGAYILLPFEENRVRAQLARTRLSVHSTWRQPPCLLCHYSDNKGGISVAGIGIILLHPLEDGTHTRLPE